MLKDIVDVIRVGSISIQNELTLIDDKIQDAQRKKDRLISVLENSDNINLDDIGSRLRQLTDAIQGLETQKSKLSAELQKTFSRKKTNMEGSIEIYMKAVSDIIESQSIWTKSLTHSVLTGVTLRNGNIEIEYKIPEKGWLPRSDSNQRPSG